MIEKPKRPKQPSIQERQPPRTLQELINRYDLDNKKIYDFLDGLVDLLNTREETVDTDISNLNNSVTNLSDNKVNRSGDTLSGELQFNNKNDYGAIRKTRTINGTDYNANFGIGANQSARIEFQDSNQINLCTLEVRANGIYNGMSNRRLPEVAYSAWGSSFTFSLTGGHALVITNQNDCLILWVAGARPDCNVVRLLGNGVQVSFDADTKMVTLKYQDNHNFTGTAFIATG